MVNNVYDVFDNETQQPVGKASVQTPVQFAGYPAKDLKKKKVDLDLQTKFNFLTVSQWGPRKNIQNTVQWFVENSKTIQMLG